MMMMMMMMMMIPHLFFDLRWRKWWEAEDCTMRSYITCTNIVRVIKSMRMRWAGHVARVGETRNAYNKLLVKKPEGRDHSKDLGVDGKIILK
jgi:hypothetical protein